MAADVFQNAEAIFGGIVLLGVLLLIITGRIRLEREISYRDQIIEKQNATIQEQRETIASMQELFQRTQR